MRPSACLLLALAAAVAGCERAGAGNAAGQLLARVNGAEISAQQAPTRQALEKVIDRELLVQQAIAAGLERDPQVKQSLESARRQLLAQAWLERSAGAARSAPDEVHAFYAENPALFAERRIYRLRELVLSAPGELADVLRAQAAEARDLEDVAAWLRARNAKFSIATVTQSAEHLPLAYLPQLARMKEGDIAGFAAPPGAAVVQLLHAQEAPLTEQQAAPLIEQFLAGRKKLELAAAEVKRLRQVAKIEYVGELKR
jgi:EpsD family peptidyl-prolyl cis-trans isomerase